ncbi:MAG: DNA translocase FtsK 4TM domain-containing protein [Magnetococcales bacterium]|nr:DNA translocase FtsK 4TM domain-containing protein [Magnetococcales bacterium]
MASRGNQYRQKKVEAVLRRRTILREGLGILFLCLTAYLAISLFSYSPNDPSFNQTSDGPLQNLGGVTGAYLADILLQSFGYSSGWLLIFCGLPGLLLFRRGETLKFWDRLAALPMLAVVTTLLSSILMGDEGSVLPAGPGGMAGYLGAQALVQTIGLWGSLILLVPLGILSLMVIGRFSIINSLEQVQERRQEQQAALDKQPPPLMGEAPVQVEESVSKGEALAQFGGALWGSLIVVPAIVQRFFAKLIQKKEGADQPEWLTPMEADPVSVSYPERVEPELDDFTRSEPDFFLSEPESDHKEPGDEPVVEDLSAAPSVSDIPEAPEWSEPQESLAPELPDSPLFQHEVAEPEVTLTPEPEEAEPWHEEPEEMIEPVILSSFEASEEVVEESELDGTPEPEPIIEAVLADEPTQPIPNLKPLEAAPEPEPAAPAPTSEIPISMPKPMGETPPSGTLESKEEEAAQDMPLPSLDMLTEPPLVRVGPTRDDLSKKARLLEQKLADFKIKGQIIDVMPGPVVTTFELDPAPGLRASKVVTISDDLARSISAESVRVVGNVPGKTVIGIELPNETRATVYLREVLLSEGFRKLNHPLAVALGSDINGVPFSANLAKMPHLLVAGTTGSGKSVAVNAMICSILFNARPDEVRFLMIDPKMLELSIYEGIPHLLAPVVTEVHKAANLLKWAVAEMEERYRLMSELGVRNLVGYNQKIERCIEKGEQPTRRVKVGFDPETGAPVEQDEPIPLEKKPLIVIVIDELADLMIQVGKEVEPAIARLAQMARAAGLHLVIATQRPSVDVITGLIKANFPTRLAFQVSSKIDSRTILDSMGAERLLGMGDGLYLPPGTSLLKRIHAPFVSDEEVNDLVKYLKSTGSPQYNNEVLVSRADEGDLGEVAASDSAAEEYDPLYDQAAAVVIRAGKVSTSMVQRHFKIGYNRAARIVERMEIDGLISAANGAGKREVLAPGGGDMD